MTLDQLLQEGTARLEAACLSHGHGTQNAHDEAVWLTLWQLGLPLDSDLDSLGPTRRCWPEEIAAVRALWQRRIDTRQPAAYLTQEAWLQGVPFYVDERVIVPRSFLAEPIAADPHCEPIDDWLNPDTKRVLDLCTGNGSLAILAALAWPEVQIDAADISSDALAVAAINVARHGLQERVRLLHSDGWTGIDGRYDLVLCNPPYVCRESMAQLPPEYRAEPLIALDGGLEGGSDGMDFVRRLLAKALDHLEDGGVLLLEIGNERAHFEAAFPGLPGHWIDSSVGPGPVVLLTQAGLHAWQTGGQA